jgi:hypothetical protein
MFDEFFLGAREHYLFGTLIVRAVSRKTRRPVAGVRARVGTSTDDACRGG